MKRFNPWLFNFRERILKVGMNAARHALTVTLVVAHCMNVHAANVFSAASGDWGNPATWSTGLIPGSSDNVFIGSGHTVTVDVGVACTDLHVGRGTAIPNGGTIIFGPGSLHVLGDVTIGVPLFGAGIVSMTQGELLLDGSLTIPNGAFIATGGAVRYEGIASQTIASLSYYDLTLSNGPKVAGGPITVNGDLVIFTSCSFDASSFTHHVKGDWASTGFFEGGTSTVILNGVPTQNISGSNLFHHLIMDGGDKILSVTFGSTTITGNLTINAGANFIPNGGTTFTVDGDWTNNGTFQANGGTVILNGNSTQRIDNGSGSFNNLTLSGAGTKNAFGTITVDGDFTVNAASTYHVQPAYDTHLKGQVTVNGTLDLGNTTVWLEGTGPQNVPGGQTYGTLRLVGSTKTATGALTVNGNLIVAADAIFNPSSYNHHLKGNLNNYGTVNAGTGFTIFDGSSSQFIRESGSTTFNHLGFISSLTTAEASFTSNDELYIDGSASFDAGSNTITVKGDWNNGGTFIPGTSTVILNSPSPQSIIGSSTFKNLTLSGVGTKTANASITVDSTFTINSAATFSSGSVIHHFNGDWTLNGTFLANAGTIAFSGAHPQRITGRFRFNNVAVENDSGVTLISAPGDSIAGALTFTAGPLLLGVTDLTLEPTATVTGAAGGKCIVTDATGRVRRTIQGGTSAEVFTFPIAPNKTSYNPLSIALRPDAAEPTETFTTHVEEFTNASIGYSVMDTAFCTWRVWTIEEETIGGNRTNLAFQWDPDEDGSNIGIDLANPVLAMAYLYVNGTGRYEAVDDAVGPAPLNNPIIAATLGYTTLSFGSYIVGNAVALPVQISSFTGVEIPNVGVRLNWRTISEVNNYGFYVQRKRQADSAWSELSNSFTPGNGTTNEPHEYAFLDSTVAGGEWQYRLRQIDLTGTSHFTESITVGMLTDVQEPQLPSEFALRQNYPNPFNPATNISFDLPKSEHVLLKVYDMVGREVATLVNETRLAGRYSERFDASGLASGMYFYRLTTPSYNATKKFLLIR